MPNNPTFQDQQAEFMDTLHQGITLLLGILDEYADVSDLTLKERVARAHHRELLKEFLNFFKYDSGNPLKLKEILANNWRKYKGTTCSFTADPEGEVSLLLCSVSTILGQWLGEKPIHLLMPGLCTESIMDGVPSLDEMDLKEVLKTHVLSESGNYLYPVRALCNLACETDFKTQQIPNPYYDHNIGPENEAYIPFSAVERMLNHSPHTQAIMDAKSNYQSLIKPTNLLGQLHLLIKTLRMNSVAGIGKEETAGERVYAGIISFNEYYQTLSNEQKIAIPLDVKNKIELLLALSSSKEKNHEGTENLQTCTNTLQSDLAFVTKEHEHVLINIGVDGETQSALIKKAREAFVERQHQLSQQCDSGKYKGKDELTLTKKLIESLNVPISLVSDFEDFISLTATDIQSLLENNKALQDQLIQKFDNLDALIAFTTQAPIEQMKVILISIAGKLPKPQNNEFSVWLEMLDLKRFKVILNFFKDSIISTGTDFGEIIEHLDAQKRDMIFEEYVQQLPDLIQSAEDVDNALTFLSNAQRARVYESVKHKFVSLIKNGYEFGCVLEFLSPSQRDEVYKQMKDTIADLIQNAEDLGVALQYLNTAQCEAVVHALKDRLNSIITSAQSVSDVLKYVNTESRAVVFEAIKGRFSWLIRNVKNLSKALEFLNVEQCKVVLEKIEHRLPKLINCPKHIQQVLAVMGVEQCKVLVDAMKDILAKQVQVLSDVNEVLTELGVQQSTVVLEAIKKKLHSLIQSPYALGQILNALDIHQIPVLLDAMKNRLHRLIQKQADLNRVIQKLGFENRVVVLVELNERLPSSIQLEHVNDYLVNLNDDSSKILLEMILPCLIQNATNFSQTLKFLDNRWRNTAFDAIKHRFTALIQTANDVSIMLASLSVEQRVFVFETIKDRLPSIIKTSEDVNKVLKHLTVEQRNESIHALKNISDFIQSSKDIENIFEYIEQNQRDMLFKAIKHKLPSFVHHPIDVGLVLKYLTDEQCTVVLKAIKDKLPSIFNTAEDVDNMCLNAEKCALVKAAWRKAQVQHQFAENPPTFLPHKRLIAERESTAKRQKQPVASREVAYLQRSAALEASRERRRQEKVAKLRTVNREVAYLQQSAALEESRERRRQERAIERQRN